MPDPANTRIVINSYVLAELAAQFGEESGGRGNPAGLLSVITKCRHVICTTESIKTEYGKAEKSGQYPELRGLLTPVVLQLEDMGIAKQCRTGSMPDPNLLKGLGKQHSSFVQDALRTGAKYLLTANPLWLKKEAIGNLFMVTSDRYVQWQQQ